MVTEKGVKEKDCIPWWRRTDGRANDHFFGYFLVSLLQTVLLYLNLLLISILFLVLFLLKIIGDRSNTHLYVERNDWTFFTASHSLFNIWWIVWYETIFHTFEIHWLNEWIESINVSTS
jgi:hypothetical protein